MNEKKLLYIYNPVSGVSNALGAPSLTDILTIFINNGFRTEVYPTQKRNDCMERIMNIEPEFERVVVAGGDGTLNEAVTGLMKGGADIPLGYIPMGSTNDFANSLGLPTATLEAAKVASTGMAKKVDVGQFEERYFVYVAAFGAFTSVSYETGQKMKNVLGHAAYLLNSVKSWTDIKPFKMTVECNGITKEDEYIYGMITNTKSVGGMKNLAGLDVELSDGLFEVTLIRQIDTIFDLPGIVSNLLSGELDNEFIESYKTSEITLHSAKLLPWTVDGEFGGDHRKVHIKNRKCSLNMILPDGVDIEKS